MARDTGQQVENNAQIPETLLEPVEAARNWLNESNGTNYDVTGLVDYESALEVLPEEPFKLGLILCDGENCKREKVQFFPNGSTGKEDYRFEVEQPDFEMPAELDPPPGLRKAWLDKKLGDQAFLLLLFYRGRW